MAAFSEIDTMISGVRKAITDAQQDAERSKNTNIKLGKELRRLRKKAGISLRTMATSLDLSAPFLSDLERGNRTWTAERAKLFITKLKSK